MKTRQKTALLFGAALACFTGMAAQFLFVRGVYLQQDPAATLRIRLLFWGLMLLGLILTAAAAVFAEGRIRSGKYHRLQRKLPGIISFFRNIPGTVSDLLLLVCAVGLLVFRNTGVYTSGKYEILMGITVLAFCMHSMFNGRTYAYITSSKKKSGGKTK